MDIMQQDRFGNDSTYQTNRYTLSGNDNFSYSIGATYTEPLYTFKPKPEPEDSTQQARGPFGNRIGAVTAVSLTAPIDGLICSSI